MKFFHPKNSTETGKWEAGEIVRPQFRRRQEEKWETSGRGIRPKAKDVSFSESNGPVINSFGNTPKGAKRRTKRQVE